MNTLTVLQFTLIVFLSTYSIVPLNFPLLLSKKLSKKNWILIYLKWVGIGLGVGGKRFILLLDVVLLEHSDEEEEGREGFQVGGPAPVSVGLLLILMLLDN